MKTGHDKTASTPHSPQIKICGLTDPGEALYCAELGVDAIGFVFFPKSPRHLTLSTAREIRKVLPSSVTTVGVFVNESFETIMATVTACGLTGVQLHGQEPPSIIQQLQQENLTVIKALFVNGAPSLQTADDYASIPFLVECAHGKLPGGNAISWDWGSVCDFGRRKPLILAGGLTAHNIEQAIQEGQPDAVDISSGVESAPGKKDRKKIRSFVDAVRRSRVKRDLRTIFDHSPSV